MPTDQTRTTAPATTGTTAGTTRVGTRTNAGRAAAEGTAVTTVTTSAAATGTGHKTIKTIAGEEARRTETAGAASADTTGGGTIATRTTEAVSRIPGTRVATEGTAVTTVTTSPIRSATTTRITNTRRFRPEDTTVRLGTHRVIMTADLMDINDTITGGVITEVDTGVSTEVKTGSVDAEGGTNSGSIDGAPVQPPLLRL